VKYQDNGGGRGAPGYPKEWLDSVGYGTKKIVVKKK